MYVPVRNYSQEELSVATLHCGAVCGAQGSNNRNQLGYCVGQWLFTVGLQDRLYPSFIHIHATVAMLV